MKRNMTTVAGKGRGGASSSASSKRRRTHHSANPIQKAKKNEIDEANKIASNISKEANNIKKKVDSENRDAQFALASVNYSDAVNALIQSIFSWNDSMSELGIWSKPAGILVSKMINDSMFKLSHKTNIAANLAALACTMELIICNIGNAFFNPPFSARQFVHVDKNEYSQYISKDRKRSAVEHDIAWLKQLYHEGSDLNKLWKLGVVGDSFIMRRRIVKYGSRVLVQMSGLQTAITSYFGSAKSTSTFPFDHYSLSQNNSDVSVPSNNTRRLVAWRNKVFNPKIMSLTKYTDKVIVRLLSRLLDHSKITTGDAIIEGIRNWKGFLVGSGLLASLALYLSPNNIQSGAEAANAFQAAAAAITPTNIIQQAGIINPYALTAAPVTTGIVENIRGAATDAGGILVNAVTAVTSPTTLTNNAGFTNAVSKIPASFHDYIPFGAGVVIGGIGAAFVATLIVSSFMSRLYRAYGVSAFSKDEDLEVQVAAIDKADIEKREMELKRKRRRNVVAATALGIGAAALLALYTSTPASRASFQELILKDIPDVLWTGLKIAGNGVSSSVRWLIDNPITWFFVNPVVWLRNWYQGADIPSYYS